MDRRRWVDERSFLAAGVLFVLPGAVILFALTWLVAAGAAYGIGRARLGM